MTEALARSGIGGPSARAELPLWVLAAHTDTCPAESRATFALRARQVFGVDAPILETCHRVEIYGAGTPAEAQATLERVAAEALRARIRVLTGDAAARHVLRLAAGLESAVIGEDQVLHQVRELRDALRGAADPALARVLELAIGVGRRARAERPASRTVQTLATRAIDWLVLEGGLRSGETLLVVGAGRMGGLLAREGRRRGLRVGVASRSRERARSIAEPLGAAFGDLDWAVANAPRSAAVTVALAGPWAGIGDANGRIPPLVDLSSPPATPVSRHSDAPRIDIDGLYRWDGLSGGGESAEYVERASGLIEATLESYRRWWAGRASVATLRALRTRAERERDQHLARLLRRLPDLTDVQRALIEEHTDQLVAALMHAPTARLRDDADGSAADAARRLFGL